MQLLSQLLSLPPPLLVLFAAGPWQLTAAQPWPYNLPAHQKYWPEHEQFIKRDIEIKKKLATETPIGVRKMSQDPSQMFFLDYWQFAGDSHEEGASDKVRRGSDKFEESDNRKRRDAWLQDRRGLYSNTSMTRDFLPPFLLHSEAQSEIRMSPRPLPRSVLEDQQFQCPGGTNSCTSIDRPYSCCATDENCVIIPRTNELGDVGCCPKGVTCGGGALGCDTVQGYSSCPGSSNGGCCIPNYICDGVGCIYSAPSTVVTVPPSSQPTLSVTTKVIYTTVLSTPIVIGTLTVTDFASTVTLPIIGPTTCKVGFQSCPASLDGGCCPTGLVCESGASCGSVSTATELLTTTVVPNAPVRPTAEPSIHALTTTTVYPSVCPTGYYQCSAYYPGGCCQVGRDCASTDCPVTASTTVVSSAVTVVVPGGSGTTFVVVQGSSDVVTSPTGPSTQGGCAAGWFLCGSGSSDCCPYNYICGSDATCTNNGAALGPDKVKEVPVGQSNRLEGLETWMAGLAIAIGIGMLLL